MEAFLTTFDKDTSVVSSLPNDYVTIRCLRPFPGRARHSGEPNGVTTPASLAAASSIRGNADGTPTGQPTKSLWLSRSDSASKTNHLAAADVKGVPRDANHSQRVDSAEQT